MRNTAKSIFKKPDTEEKIINLNPENIKEAKEILDTLKKKNFMKKIKMNPLEDMNSLKVLKESGFFNTKFLESNKNSKKIKISKKDIEEVFKILNPTTNGNRVFSKDLKEKIPFLNSKIPESEINLLTNNKQHMSSDELYNLLNECEYNDFDPIEEVFKMLDFKNKGNVEVDYLSDLMKDFNIRKIDDKEKGLILECLDLDKDGKIGLEDIRELLKTDFLFHKEEEEDGNNNKENIL